MKYVIDYKRLLMNFIWSLRRKVCVYCMYILYVINFSNINFLKILIWLYIIKGYYEFFFIFNIK